MLANRTPAVAQKPETRLQDALREFESMLTKDQRQLYNTRVKSGRPPSMEDVIETMSEIDRESRKERGIHKCVGPRLMKVLEACQRFAAIGDVLIGGSQNLIACGLWSAVRLSLQMSVGNGAFFDKLSLLIMEIGRTAPINEEIGLLAPDSPRLQYLVAEYMLRVVSICKEMVKLSNKSSLAQLVSSISGFDATFGQLSNEVKSIGHVIEQQVALLSAKTNVSEARENQGSRALLRGLSSETRRQAREVKMVRFFLELCSHQRDFDATRANIRQKGVVDWIFKEPEYSKWKMEQSSCVLNLVGKLGSGKSVVMANVVDDLHLKVPHSSSQEIRPAVAYMFYTHGLRQICVPRHIIGSLALQILRSSVLRTAVEKFIDDQRLPDILYSTVSSIVSTTSSILKSLSKPPGIFIILDGLDECSLDDQNEIALALCKWKANSNLHLMSSSRNAMYTFEQVSSPGFRITTSQNNSDLANFISSETKRRGELCQRPAEHCQRVAKALSDGADGMYLWASLMLDLVLPTHLEQPDVLDVENLIKELPQSLSDVYEKLLVRVQDRDRARRLLKLIAEALRPLSIGEVIDALSVNPGTQARETLVILKKPADFLNQLGGSLLYIEEADETIHFIHESALSHLVPGRSSEFGFSVEEAQRYMGGVCTAYLTLPQFNGSLQKNALETGSLTVAPQGLVNNAVQTALPKPMQKTVGSLLSRLRTRKSRQADLTRIVNELLAFSPAPRHHLFYPYCKEFWLEHTKYSRISAQTADQLWLRFMDNPGTLQFPWGASMMDRLDWSLQHAHPSVLAFSMQDASESVFAMDILLRTINHFLEGHDDTWSVFRDAFLSPDSLHDGDIIYLLIRLATASSSFFPLPQKHFQNLVRYLCRFGFPNCRHVGRAEIEVKTPHATPLGAACEADISQRTFLVRFLLELKADPNAAFLDSNHTVTRPLAYVFANHEEAENWQSRIAGLLVAAGADVNASTKSWPHCPLIATCTPSVQGQTEQLIWLLRRGADPYAECPGVGMSVVQYLMTESGLQWQSKIKILSIMWLHRQKHMSGSQAYTYLVRLVTEVLDGGMTKSHFLQNKWMDHSDATSTSHRQTFKIALQLDGPILAEKETYGSAHLDSLMDAYEKNPTQAPMHSLMRRIYTYKGVPFSQRLRIAHLDDLLMHQLLHWIVAFGQVDTIWELAQYEMLRGKIVTCRFLLHRAVLTAHLTGNPDCLKALLTLGLKVDDPGPRYREAPLFWAVWLRNQGLASLLISHGAQVGTTLPSSDNDLIEPNGTFGPAVMFNEDNNSYQIQGVTHLHHDRGASHLRGLQPLLAAVLVKDSEMVCLLLRHHAKIDGIEHINEEMRRGWTQVVAHGLLSEAAMKGLAEMTPQDVSDVGECHFSTAFERAKSH